MIGKVKTSALIYCIYLLTVHNRQIDANQGKTLVSSATSTAPQCISGTSITGYLSVGEIFSLSVTVSTSSTRSAAYGPPLPHLKYICDVQSEETNFCFPCRVTLADDCIDPVV